MLGGTPKSQFTAYNGHRGPQQRHLHGSRDYLLVVSTHSDKSRKLVPKIIMDLELSWFNDKTKTLKKFLNKTTDQLWSLNAAQPCRKFDVIN